MCKHLKCPLIFKCKRLKKIVFGNDLSTFENKIEMYFMKTLQFIKHHFFI